MNNFKENKAVFFVLLIGLGFFGFLTFLTLKAAFTGDYVHIVLLILGGFFGFFAILFLIFLFHFITNKDIWEISWNVKTAKWNLFKYFPALLAIVCFVMAVKFYQTKEEIANTDYVEITITQTNTPKIENVKSSKYISISTKEYPMYRFHITGTAYKNMLSEYYFNNVKSGDTLMAIITSDAYNKKIAQTKQLTFTDKTINYQSIDVYGLKHKGFKILSTNDYEKAKESNSKLTMIFFILAGFFFLYLQYMLNKGKKAKSIKNEIANKRFKRKKRY